MVLLDYAYLRDNNMDQMVPMGRCVYNLWYFWKKKVILKKTVNYKRAINLIRSWVSESKSSIDLCNNYLSQFPGLAFATAPDYFSISVCKYYVLGGIFFHAGGLCACIAGVSCSVV